MKIYNEKIIGDTIRFSHKTLQNSMNIVDKLTHPSKKVSYIGSAIGGIVGIGLIGLGIPELIKGHNLLGVGSILAGVFTVASNIINVKKRIK